MSSRHQLVAPRDYAQEIKKSRFLALARPLATPEQAPALIKANHFADARHHCWAWRFDEAYRFSDDGEPGGTAGRPILQAIDGRAADRLLVIVVRWFGGIKLGTGGLVRAYGGTAAECLREADYQRIRPSAHWRVDCEFRDLTLLRARLQPLEAHFEQEIYGATGQVSLYFQAPNDQLTAIQRCVAAITRRHDALESVQT